MAWMLDEDESTPTPPIDPTAAAPTEVLRDLLQRGLITREEFDLRARTAQTSAGLEVERLLVERGFSPDAGPQSAPTDPGGAPSAVPSAPPRRLGKYTLVREVGSGGMGAVYEARQDGLNRTVALKVLHLDSTLAVERFRREGQALATLHHPNIVQVYEAGEEGGKSFLAMEFVAGPSLEGLLARGKDVKAPPRIDARQVGGWLAQVADALHHAHRAGIVHRDVKPANILLAPGDVPKVTDFGLAKKLDAESKLTLSGALMGTPYYMAPEQAGGRTSEIDARTDVYALGVVLYQLLTGALPHVAEEVSTLLERIQSQEPVRPRVLDDRIPPDLETIVLLCLEKEPRRRYETAALLAADLRRWLAGEPVEARRPSTWYRVRRWVRRHRALSASGAALLVAAAGMGTLLHSMSERARLDIEGARAEIASTNLYHEADKRLAVGLAVRRTGDTSELEHEVRDVVALADAALSKNPANVEAHFVKGWTLALSGRWAEAVLSYDEVLRRSPRDPLPRYGRGWAYIVLFDRARDEALRRWWAERTRGSIAAIPTEGDLEQIHPDVAVFRARASEDFARLEAASADVSGLRECAQGFVALAAGEAETARRRFEEAVRIAPKRDEAWEGLARAVDRLWIRQELDLAGALAVLDGAIAANRGLDGLYLVRSKVLEDAAHDRLSREGGTTEADALWKRAEEDATRAVDLWPPASSELVARCWARTARAEATWTLGLPGAEAGLAAAIEDGDRAVQQEPGSGDALNARGHAHSTLGEWRTGNGVDPTGAFEAAVRDFQAAAALGPADSHPEANLGNAWSGIAAWQAKRGGNPGLAFSAALEAFGRALDRNPRNVNALNSRAVTRTYMGERTAARGGDSGETYALAGKDLDAAIALDPESLLLRCNRGGLALRRAEWKASQGADTAEEIARAAADFDEALEQGGSHAIAWLGRAESRRMSAHRRAARGEDAVPELEAALVDLSRACALAPGLHEVWSSRGEVREDLADAREARGLDASALRREAEEDYGAALARDPASIEALLGRARARLDLCESSVDDDREALERAAFEDLEAAAAIAQDEPTLLLVRADARARRAQRDASRGKDPSIDFHAAIADYDRAIEGNPSFCQALENRAAVHVLQGKWVERIGGDARESYRAAIEDCTEALKHNPGLDVAHLNRAAASIRLGDLESGGEEAYGRAMTDLDAAVRLNPAAAAPYSSRAMVWCRRAERKVEAGEDPTADLEAAVRECDLALARDPRHRNAGNYRALALVRFGAWKARGGGDPRAEYVQAAEAYTRLLDLDPSSPDLLRNRGNVRLQTGQWLMEQGLDPVVELDRAVEDFDRLLGVDPSALHAFNGRAVARKSLGRWLARQGKDASATFAAALADYDRALALDADSATARLNRGLLLEEMGRLEEALTACERAAGLSPGSRAGAAADRIRKKLGR